MRATKSRTRFLTVDFIGPLLDCGGAAAPGRLGETQEKPAQLARALAFRVLVDQIEAGEVDALAVNSVSFAAVPPRLRRPRSG